MNVATVETAKILSSMLRDDEITCVCGSTSWRRTTETARHR